MKKILLCMPIVVLAIVPIPLRSEALGGESLGCFVNQGTPGTFTSPTCEATLPKLSYTVPFKVLNGSGTYSYAWTTSGLTVSSGCTSTSDTCIIAARGSKANQTLTVSVAITQSGASSTLSASAFIPPVCLLGTLVTFC
jgi:hypothetical protein